MKKIKQKTVENSTKKKRAFFLHEGKDVQSCLDKL